MFNRREGIYQSVIKFVESAEQVVLLINPSVPSDSLDVLKAEVGELTSLYLVRVLYFEPDSHQTFHSYVFRESYMVSLERFSKILHRTILERTPITIEPLETPNFLQRLEAIITRFIYRDKLN